MIENPSFFSLFPFSFPKGKKLSLRAIPTRRKSTAAAKKNHHRHDDWRRKRRTTHGGRRRLFHHGEVRESGIVFSRSNPSSSFWGRPEDGGAFFFFFFYDTAPIRVGGELCVSVGVSMPYHRVFERAGRRHRRRDSPSDVAKDEEGRWTRGVGFPRF